MGLCLFFQIHKNNCGAPLNDAPLCRGDRTRTCDSLVPNQERYQLRYTSLLYLSGCKGTNNLADKRLKTEKSFVF